MTWPQRSGKFNAKRSTNNGHTYHSGREAEYAKELDWRIKAGDLKSWKRQAPIELRVNGKLILHLHHRLRGGG
jgi:hypothetical protein